ncbi:MAG: S8 family serine peptidase, partial [Candidatus Thorarchaeota archaeon]
KKQILNLDKNENGLDDELEEKLKNMVELGSFNEESKEIKLNSDNKNPFNDIFLIGSKKQLNFDFNNIPIIAIFPEGNYHTISLLYESLGGKIKSTFKTAINGFSGRINKDALYEFSYILKQNKIPFFIEEDKIYHAQLYYTGRSMNLRPYVWNNLSYDGDDYSSIAVIDTGVDASHNFFSPGYAPGDFNYKVVGWRDEINSLTSPYDDNGHGSHCSGIVAGNGNPSYDGNGRTVSTVADNLDYTSYNIYEGLYLFNETRFNVTDSGLIELNCEFEDATPGPDDVDLWAYLYYENSLVDSYIVDSDSWSHTLSYSVTSDTLGVYSFRFILNLVDNTGDGYVSDLNITYRSINHWPFDPPQFSCGDPWKGVAPDAKIVGVKVLNEHGGGYSSDIISGINWVINNKIAYNITTISLSVGGPAGDVALINAFNNAVDNGIVTVVSAGNRGPGSNNVECPGDADNVITVAAMNLDDGITDYSAEGGLSYTGNTTKPDIAAPGGSYNNLQIFSADTNDNDGETIYPTDGYANDLAGAQGTSMAAPAVAGASNLLIEAMGGHPNWGYSSIEAKRVKALLLMSATETYPLLRETYSSSNSPLLNRGSKDNHEGYGRINVDVAIEAYTQELELNSYKNAWISSSVEDAFNKHALGCYVNLTSGLTYNFSLDVPIGADFDLHLYSNNPSSIGEPIMLDSSTSPVLGRNEMITYTATETGKYYLIAKAISGKGMANISYPIIERDLSVTLEVPEDPKFFNTYIINATILNAGNLDENNVNLTLYLNNAQVNSTILSTLNVGNSETIKYKWIPTEYKTYNFTAYAIPVVGETFIENNLIVKIIPNSLTITSPDNSASWETGVSQYIYWASFGSISTVKIELYRNDIFEIEITASTMNDGEFYWTIPSSLENSMNYQIKITDALDSLIYDYSQYFVIFNSLPSSITVIFPDSSIIWETGTSHYIHWTSTGIIANVKIELYNNNIFIIEIIPNTLNDGVYNWTIPTEIIASDKYQIKVLDDSNPLIYDFSGYFEIRPPRSGSPIIPGYSLCLTIGVICFSSIIFIKRKIMRR